MIPVQITIRDLPNSPVLEDHIRKRAQKVTRYFQKINTCRVVVTLSQKHKHQGKLFSVHIDLSVPGKELAVTKQKNEDIYIAIRDAFNALLRQLENYVHRKKGQVKTHELQNHGSIVRLVEDEFYGFIRDSEGNEYYFSTANVAYPTFDQLKIGDTVQFIGLHASEGLQANHITKERSNHFEESIVIS